ncbi:hypothetical protein HPB48_003303 [Haemaphysalis longicornis]|uniref:Uncharacterized protein n=1 Tax=Haemaphysalis longicornis TaxID=44386 RepID=A0A9J6H0L9_HAELO|nr:hypothetical protein HPB48_003303 [Haemaphysalis longicornis]
MATEAVTVAEEARPNVDLELEQRVKGTCGRISENVHIFANEPSLACYRLQEHVRKSLQPAVERRLQMAELRQELRGKCYDLDYAIAALRGIPAERTASCKRPGPVTQRGFYEAAVVAPGV